MIDTEKRVVIKQQYMRAREIADNYPIGLSTIWDWAKKGRLTPIKITDGMTVFSTNEIEKLFKGNAKPKKVRRRRKRVSSIKNSGVKA